jgi:hypothetical protein
MAVLDFRRRMVLTRRHFQMVARTCVLPENKQRENKGVSINIRSPSATQTSFR